MSLPQLPEAGQVSPVEVVRGQWARFQPQMIILAGDLAAVAIAAFLSAAQPLTYEIVSAALLLLAMLLWGLYQTRMSLLSMIAAQNTYRLWQSNWENLNPLKKAA